MIENLINNLNGLHIEIGGVKGFEVNKIVNPQKFATRRECYGAPITNSPNNINHNHKKNPSYSSTGTVMIRDNITNAKSANMVSINL